MIVLKFQYLKIVLPILFILLLIVLTKAPEQINCQITPPILDKSEVNGSSINFYWKNGQNSKITYLNVSTSNSLKPDQQTLEDPNIVNDTVTDRISYLKTSLKPGTYYWNVVSDGCRQRKASDLGSFTIEENSETVCKLEPAVLNSPVVKGSIVTLSWTSSQSVETAFINISSSNKLTPQGTLEKLDISNDVITGKASLIRENLSPGTYYWNVISDGCSQRKISNLGSFSIK